MPVLLQDRCAGSTIAMFPRLSGAAINQSWFNGPFMKPKDLPCEPAGNDVLTESLAGSST